MVTKNQLKDMAERARKKQKGLGAFVKLNAGDVEKGVQMFNRATDVGEAPTSGIGESIEPSIYESGSKVSLTNAPDKVYKKDFNELYVKLRDTTENKWDYRVSTYGDKFKIEIEKAVGATKGTYGPVGGKWKTIKTIYSIDEDSLTESTSTSQEYKGFDKFMNNQVDTIASHFSNIDDIEGDEVDRFFDSLKPEDEVYFVTMDKNNNEGETFFDMDEAINYVEDPVNSDSKVYAFVNLSEDGMDRKSVLVYEKDDEFTESVEKLQDNENCTNNDKGDNMRTINISEELFKRDFESCDTNFLTMYESIDLSLDKKKELAKMLSENVSNEDLDKFFENYTIKDISDNVKDTKLYKNLKEEYGDYYGEPYNEEIAEQLEDGIWASTTNNGTPWELTIMGMPSSEFSPSFADYLAEEISYPVKDGHLSYQGLDLILNKNALPPHNADADELEKYIPDLIKLGFDRNDIDNWLKDDADAELETSIHYDIDFNVDEWEENNKEDINLPDSVTYDFYTLVDDDVDINSDDYNLDDVIADRLSDDYGYTHNGFEYNVDKESGDVYVYDIKWDLSENLKESYTHFDFEEGNPYIAKTEEEKQKILNKYGNKVKEIKPNYYKVYNKESTFITESNENKLYAILNHSDMTDITFALIGKDKEQLLSHKNDLFKLTSDSIEDDYEDSSEYWDNVLIPIIQNLQKDGMIFISNEGEEYKGKYLKLRNDKWYFGKDELEIIDSYSSRF